MKPPRVRHGSILRAVAHIVLCGSLLTASPAHASANLDAGSLYRTTGVPPWSVGDGSFTIMLWVYGPSITGASNYFMADDGGAFQIYVNVGSAADDPTGPYFLTRNGEWHFNRDGSYVANPAQSFDVSAGWTFLAVSFRQGGESDLYAWQAGVNGNALVHVPLQATAASLGGSGFTSTFLIGNESNFHEGCICLLGPVYVYDGAALTKAQIDAQRQTLAPLIASRLIVFSSFTDSALTTDGSGTADWSVHGAPRYDSRNPPVIDSPGGGGTGSTTGSTTGATTGSTTGTTTGDTGGDGTTPGSGTGGTGGAGSGGGSGGGGGALDIVGVLMLLGASLLRRVPRISGAVIGLARFGREQRRSPCDNDKTGAQTRLARTKKPG